MGEGGGLRSPTEQRINKKSNKLICNLTKLKATALVEGSWGGVTKKCKLNL